MSWNCKSCGCENEDNYNNCKYCYKEKIIENNIIKEDNHNYNDIKQNTTLNNFCRNCGSKLTPNIKECPVCKTLVSNKRIKIDTNYKKDLVAWVISVICAFTMNPLLKVLFSIISYIIICNLYNNYRKNKIISVIYWLDTMFISIFILRIAFIYAGFFKSCLGG